MKLQTEEFMIIGDNLHLRRGREIKKKILRKEILYALRISMQRNTKIFIFKFRNGSHTNFEILFPKAGDNRYVLQV